MNREIAVGLMNNITQLRYAVNSTTDLIEQIDNEAERKCYRKEMAEIIAHTGELILLIVSKYPDLDPYKDIVNESNK